MHPSTFRDERRRRLRAITLREEVEVRKTRTVAMGAALLGSALTSAVTFVGAGAGATASAGTLTLNPASGCTSVHDPGPGYSGSIGTTQNGKAVCMAVGQKLLVFLAAPATTELGWSRIAVAPPGILTSAPLTPMFSRNVTAENFLAKRQGTVELTSERSACAVPRGSQVFCGAVLRWEAKIVVLAERKVQLPPVTTGRVQPVSISR